MVQVFSGITARNFNRTIHASNPYSISFRHIFFFFLLEADVSTYYHQQFNEAK